jgi:hypothetical protein
VQLASSFFDMGEREEMDKLRNFTRLQAENISFEERN